MIFGEHEVPETHPIGFAIGEAIAKASLFSDEVTAGFAAAATVHRKPVVTIYVRKGDHAKERIISINPIPEVVDPLTLLDAGFALDGNSATISVDPYILAMHHHDENALGMPGLLFPGERPHIASFHRWVPGGVLPADIAATWTLTKAVNDVEKALVDWLQALGCEVKFG